METASKTCTKCFRNLPLDQYSPQTSSPDGLRYECRDCQKRYMAEWRSQNRQKMRDYEKARVERMSPEERARKRALDLKRYHADPTIARDKLLRKKYGISLVEYDDRLAAQNGVCAICGADPAGRTLHVDHHHGSGAVRGLLCSNCNTGLGMFRDSPEFLTQAIAYLLNT